MIETDFHLAKTVDMEKINVYVRYSLINIPRLFRFYDENSAPFCFYNYQGRQRSNAEMTNILINRRTKYNKPKRKKQSRIGSNAKRKERRSKKTVKCNYGNSA